jgi:hypothetical protein
MSYYVYKLVDPRDGKPFYIGKGTDDRYAAHVKEAKKGLVSRKCDRIREILAANLEVQVEIVRKFDFENQAYAYEAKLIKRIGLENLTNVAPGGGAPRKAVGVAPMEMVRSCVRMARVLTRYKEVGWRFGGKWHDLPRDTAIKILSGGVAYVCKSLGDADAKTAFAKYNIDLVEAREA